VLVDRKLQFLYYCYLENYVQIYIHGLKNLFARR
jgi:hypothetical protein